MILLTFLEWNYHYVRKIIDTFELMFFLKKIALTQFKNYTNKSFGFTDRVVSICGNNGIGKTNLLDAIHYLCFTKSYFSSTDLNNVQHGSSGFRIDGLLEINDKAENAVCILRETGKKEFSINGEAYTKFSKHVGRYPCVVIAPDDAVLITGGSEERRHFMDALLSQINPEYLQQLIIYNKVLQQRNSLLKSDEPIDTALLHVLNEQLTEPGTYIFKIRRDFLVSFLPKVKRLYNEIAQNNEPLQMMYESKLLNNSFEELLHYSYQKDVLLQRTTMGIHKDDIELKLNQMPFKSIASQGQRKSLLFAIKLMEFEVIEEEKKYAPILLLDDVFEKLDEERISKLLDRVCKQNQGQVFITDTNYNRLKSHIDGLSIDCQYILL